MCEQKCLAHWFIFGEMLCLWSCRNAMAMNSLADLGFERTSKAKPESADRGRQGARWRDGGTLELKSCSYGSWWERTRTRHKLWYFEGYYKLSRVHPKECWSCLNVGFMDQSFRQRRRMRAGRHAGWKQTFFCEQTGTAFQWVQCNSRRGKSWEMSNDDQIASYILLF